jgi:Tfp pilus assembly protein FimV
VLLKVAAGPFGGAAVVEVGHVRLAAHHRPGPGGSPSKAGAAEALGPRLIAPEPAGVGQALPISVISSAAERGRPKAAVNQRPGDVHRLEPPVTFTSSATSLPVP